jgi:hypothetical protein
MVCNVLKIPSQKVREMKNSKHSKGGCMAGKVSKNPTFLNWRRRQNKKEEGEEEAISISMSILHTTLDYTTQYTQYIHTGPFKNLVAFVIALQLQDSSCEHGRGQPQDGGGGGGIQRPWQHG